MRGRPSEQQQQKVIPSRILEMMTDSLKYSISISIKTHTNALCIWHPPKICCCCCWCGIIPTNISHSKNCVCVFLAAIQLVMSACGGQMANQRKKTVFKRTTDDIRCRRRQKKENMSKLKAISSNDKFTVTRCLWRLESLLFFPFFANIHASDYNRGIPLNVAICRLKRKKCHQK